MGHGRLVPRLGEGHSFAPSVPACTPAHMHTRVCVCTLRGSGGTPMVSELVPAPISYPPSFHLRQAQHPDCTFRGLTRALPYLLVLLQSNRASGLMLPTARLPVFQAVIPQRAHSPTVRLQVLS